MNTKSILTLLWSLLYSCSTLSCGSDDRSEAQKEADQQEAELEPGVLDPQFSPDKLYKGMPKSEVLAILGDPKSLSGGTWVYAYDSEYCTNLKLNCYVYFDMAGFLSYTYAIDSAVMHVESF
jgi:outer membrane protein assembly factor BamE (lipoprotein component of BamABCDE complex)